MLSHFGRAACVLLNQETDTHSAVRTYRFGSTESTRETFDPLIEMLNQM